MLRVNQLSGFNAGGVETPRLTLLGTRHNGTRANPLSATFTSLPAYTGRFLVAAISLESGSDFTITGINFNGSPASFIQAHAGFFGGSAAAIAWLQLSSGTTVTVSANVSDSASGSIALFEMTGQTSNTPIASGNDASSPFSMTLNGSAPGDLLIGSYADYGAVSFAELESLTGFTAGGDTGQGAWLTGVAVQNNQPAGFAIAGGYFSYPTLAAACWR